MIKKLMKEDRRSEVQAAKDAWEAEYARQQKAYDDQKDSYNRVLSSVAKNLEEEVINAIGNTTLNLRIDVRWYGGFNSDSYQVCIDANDSNKFSDDIALSWNWSVYLKPDGTVEKDSGSWSGLKATTVAQLDDLQETLRVLKVINAIDWSTMLADANSKRPNWKDYMTLSSPSRRDRPDFEAQMKEAEIEDIIGKSVLIAGNGDGKNYRPTAKVWYLIVGETGKQYKVYSFPNYIITGARDGSVDLNARVDSLRKYSPDRIAKDRFVNNIIYRNMETMEF